MIRLARPEEADTLSALVLRSKAHWGYDAAFMARVRDTLRVTPEAIAAGGVFVAIDPGDRALGIAALVFEGDVAVLDMLFVDPAAMGRGAGRALYTHALEMAGQAGAKRMTILADPFAEDFYRSMGAETIGQVPSDSIPGRMLPLMAVELSHPAV